MWAARGGERRGEQGGGEKGLRGSHISLVYGHVHRIREAGAGAQGTGDWVTGAALGPGRKNGQEVREGLAGGDRGVDGR